MKNTQEMAGGSIKWSPISSPVIFRGDASTAYRYSALLYHDGRFHIYFTLSKVEENVIAIHGYDCGGGEGVWRPCALYTEQTMIFLLR